MSSRTAPFLWRTASPAETEKRARTFGRRLRGGELILLAGPYGAGKTCFVRGLAEGIGADPHRVASPTFTLLNIYAGKLPLYHYDIARLPHARETIELVLEQTAPGAVAVVEWGDRMEGLSGLPCWKLQFVWKGENRREIRGRFLGDAIRRPASRKR